MLGLFASKKLQLLGLDIGSSSVKLVALEKSSGTYRITHLAVEPVKSGAVADDTIKDAAAVAESIKRAWRGSRASIKDCALAVSSTSAITRTLFLESGLSESEMESQISVEAGHHVPFAIEEVNLDFQVIGPAPDDQVEVLLTASRSENINLLESVIDEAGLQVKIVDVETFALANAYLGLFGMKHGKEVSALVHIGASSMLLIVIRDGHVLYTREMSFGVQQLEQQLPDGFEGGLAALTAEPMDEAAEVEDTDDEISFDSADADSGDLLVDFHKQLVQQVNRAMQFFASSRQYQPVDLILLSGGGAGLVGLADSVAEDQGVTTQVVDVAEKLGVSGKASKAALEQHGPALVLAIGLAMRGAR